MSTKKIIMTASELQNTDVNKVSLVGKGANRIPFRITKSEDSDMFDFTAIGRRIFKQASVGPLVVAAIVNKSANMDAVVESLTKAGLSVEQKSEQGEVVVFKQGDNTFDENDTTVLKLDDTVALVCTGLQKMFAEYEFEALDFKEVMATEGFYPSFHMAKEMLGATISNIMWNADSAEVAKSAIEAATKDFAAYVTGVASVLPEKAFKADNAVSKAASMTPNLNDTKDGKDGKDTKGKKKDTSAKKEDHETSDETGTKDQPKGEPETPAAPTAEEPTPDTTSDTAAGTETGSDTKKGDGENTDGSEAILAAINALKTDLSSRITSVNEAVTTLKTQVGDVEGRLNKAEEAVHGTVHVTPEPDKTGTLKSEGPKAIGLIDTGRLPLTDAA